jgi:large subunit ribosomal protein L24
MAATLHVKKGDLVKVLSGKDRNKRGKVLSCNPEKGQVIVDGINITKRHTKPSQKMPQGGIVERPGAMAASKLMLVCPNCDAPTRIAHERDAEGKPIRVCKKCGRPID